METLCELMAQTADYTTLRFIVWSFANMFSRKKPAQDFMELRHGDYLKILMDLIPIGSEVTDQVYRALAELVLR